MANIKIKDKNGNWITIASGNANGIATSNPNESVEDVLTEHSNKIAKLERNVSWLALHGGGGAGGGHYRRVRRYGREYLRFRGAGTAAVRGL